MIHWPLIWFTSDRVMALATAVYAIVTVVMYLEIRSQVKAAHRQSEIAEKAADAAKKSADALINAERAWVMVNIGWPNGIVSLWKTTETHTTTIRIVFSCRNDGRTPAWITEKRIQFELVDKIPPEPGFWPVPSGAPQTQAPTVIINYLSEIGTEPVNVGPELERTVTLSCEGHLQDLKMLLLYGFVKYRDVFNTEERRTGFGFIIAPDNRFTRIPYFEGYQQYNKYT